MKRTTVLLPDDLAALLIQERIRRDVSTATVVREALERYLMGASVPRKLKIAAIGASDGTRRLGREAEEILAEEWGSEEGMNRLMYGTETSPHDPDSSDAPVAPSATRQEPIVDHANVPEGAEHAADVGQHAGGR